MTHKNDGFIENLMKVPAPLNKPWNMLSSKKKLIQLRIASKLPNNIPEIFKYHHNRKKLLLIHSIKLINVMSLFSTNTFVIFLFT